jgi:hypothetical protein
MLIYATRNVLDKKFLIGKHRLTWLKSTKICYNFYDNDTAHTNLQVKRH